MTTQLGTLMNCVRLFVIALFALSIYPRSLHAENPTQKKHSKPFVVGEFQGQLGNQLFIAAATVSLALDHNATPVFPCLLTDTRWGIPENYAHVLFRLNCQQVPQRAISYHYKEPKFSYSPIPYKPNMSIFGYFQSEKYFKNHKQEILNLFAPSESILSYLYKHYGDIINHSNTVAIHARSYMDEPPPAPDFHTTYGRDYFEAAMKLFPDESLFVVFSNKMEWCKSMLAGIPKNMIFIENEPYYHDLYLMSLCKHQIISNSSFSWWAAYLNSNPDKMVVCPPRWFNPNYGMDCRDLIPEDWYILNY